MVVMMMIMLAAFQSYSQAYSLDKRSADMLTSLWANASGSGASPRMYRIVMLFLKRMTPAATYFILCLEK